jgi:hypothetical protein
MWPGIAERELHHLVRGHATGADANLLQGLAGDLDQRHAAILTGAIRQGIRRWREAMGNRFGDGFAPGDGCIEPACREGDGGMTDAALIAFINSFTAPQRGSVTVANTGAFDLSLTNNFICTPTGNVTLTFSNIPSSSSEQSGNILLVNSSNYTISAAATTKVPANTLTTISASGTYWVSYKSDGTNVYLVTSGAMS